MKVRAWIAAGLVVAGCSGPVPSVDAGSVDAGQSRFDLNDVSFLFPLPETIEAIGDLPGLATPTAHGVLFPEQQFNALPALTSESLYAGIRVVAARVDPSGA